MTGIWRVLGLRFNFIWLFALPGLGLPADALAQIGHEWIKYDQEYYKISVTQTGLYKLTYQDLNNAGVPVAAIDPTTIQIFRRGTEQAIHYQHTSQDAIFDTNEYLEFYGERNDGATDVDLYKNPLHHTNPYHNLYTDTAAYFLTWRSGTTGKRMAVLAPEPNIGNLTAESAFESEVIQSYYDSYAVGNTQNGRLQSPFFDEAEGWSSPMVCTLTSNCGSIRDFTIPIQKGVASLAPPSLEILMLGRVHFDHHIEIYVGPNVNSLRLANTVNFPGFQKITITPTLSWSDVDVSGNMIVRVKAIGVNGNIERVSISYIKAHYPQNFDFNGVPSQVMYLYEKPASKSYLEIQNPPANLRLFDITNLGNASIIGTYTTGANLSAIINGTDTKRKLFATTAVGAPIAIKKVSFRQMVPGQYEYIIISNKILRTGSDPVKAFGAYRASPPGGGYDTLLVNVDLLYNQFNYGETSSRAIYQFLKFLAQGGQPKYLFIIGKGLELDFAYYRYRVANPNDFQDLVPPAGLPGSDLAYTAGLFGSTYEPGIATGRLSASTPAEVADYLDKVVVTESQPFNALWRKNMLHVSGGFQTGEPERFKGYVKGFEAIAGSPFYGAQIETKSKKTLSSVEQIDISEALNAGISMATFFGHSSTSALDFDLASLANPDVGYANEGKYPLFLVNGCNVGAIYENAKVFSEIWVLTAKKGASSFISHSSFGLENMLRTYTQYFYEHAFEDSARLQRGIGDVQRAVASQLLNLGQPTPYYLSIMYEMVLLGDPALRVFGATLPDYALQEDFVAKVSLDGKPVTAASEKFALSLKVRNYGQARNDSLRVSITRSFPDNSVQKWDTLLKPVFYEEEFSLLVRNRSGAGGINTFTIQLDDPQALAELDETNNTASLAFFLPASSTYNLWPYHESLVNTTSLELIFQNTNQIPATREFELELDTTSAFNSPYLQQFSITANVLARKSITLLNQAGTYFWRTKLKQPQPGESTDWYTTSFNYRSFNPDGWGQFNKHQWQGNQFDALAINSVGQFEFDKKTSTLFVQNFGSAHTNLFSTTSIKVNGLEMNIGTLDVCRNNTINLIAFDKNTSLPYAPISFGNNDTRACGTEPQYILNFTQAQAQAASLGMQAAIDGMTVGDSVLLFTIGNPNVAGWSSGLLTTLGGIGLSSAQLAGFQAGEPLIILGKKGAPTGQAKVIRTTLAPANQQELALDATITGREPAGKITTPEIGPAKEWRYFNQEFSQTDANDVKEVKIIGITPAQQEVTLYQGPDNFVNLAFVNAAAYPTLKLEFTLTDAVTLTPAQMENWVVAYTPFADGILLTRNGNQPIEKFEGEEWKPVYSFINVSKFTFPIDALGDSLDFEFDVFNPDNGKHFTQAKKIKSPAPFDSTLVAIEVSNIGLGGLNRVSMVINASQKQELNFFNNSIQQENLLSVVVDEQPPVLDVTVDGRYLSQGDVVAPNPHVFVQLFDAYRYRLKSDTAGIVIQFTNEETEESFRVNFSASTTQWLPATNAAPFKINFTYPLFAGTWILSIQATDASGNRAASPYSVKFEVVDEEGIAFGMPYPNPTKDWVYFPIKISGPVAPTELTLEIFSPQGKKFATFDETQINGLYVGSNILKLNTEELNQNYTPAGVYFYKLMVTLNSKTFTNTGRLVIAGK